MRKEAASGDLLVYQFATASAIATWLQARPETLVVNYHNVTPPDLYAAWDNGMARHQLRAQAELRSLAPRAALGLAVSSFNESELRQAGFGRTAVVPPAAMAPTGDAHRRGHGLGRAPSGTPDRPGARWISVGRLAPNKGDRVRRHGAPRSPGARRSGGPRSKSWAGRWCRRTRRPSIASSKTWASTTP